MKAFFLFTVLVMGRLDRGYGEEEGEPPACTPELRTDGRCRQEWKDERGFTGSYVGQFKDNKPHGRGVWKYGDGIDEWKYDGEWVKGKQEGTGSLWTPNNDLYEGQWKNGWREGEGKMHFKNNDGKVSYVGDYEKNLMHGVGDLTYTKNGLYNGQWKYNRRHGTGHMEYGNGDIYNGEWSKGRPNGKGKMTYKNKNSYDGEWSHGFRHGEGQFVDATTGETYIGNWFEGTRSGVGQLKYYNGDLYYGNWTKDRRQGYGTLMYANHTGINGYWWKDKLIQTISHLSTCFKRDFISGVLERLPSQAETPGKTYNMDADPVVCIDHDGTVFYNKYINNTRNGDGVMFDPKSNLVKAGTWKDGKFESGITVDFEEKTCETTHFASERNDAFRFKFGDGDRLHFDCPNLELKDHHKEMIECKRLNGADWSTENCYRNQKSYTLYRSYYGEQAGNTNKKHGFGIYLHGDEWYMGEYKDDKRKGVGFYKNSKYAYFGQQNEDQQPNQFGMRVSISPKTRTYLVGKFERGHATSMGAQLYADGNIFIGSFETGKKSGQGIYIIRKNGKNIPVIW